MKTIVLIMTLAMSMNVYAFGDTDNSSRASAEARASASASSRQHQGQAQGQLQGQVGNTTTVGSNDVYKATDGRDWAPAVSAPNLTTGICMGSVSAGGSGAGFGISFGTTVADKECQVRYNSIRLEQIGQNDASTVILCQVLSMKIALEQSGYDCPTVNDDDDVGVAGAANAFPDTAYDSQAVIGSGFYR